MQKKKDIPIIWKHGWSTHHRNKASKAVLMCLHERSKTNAAVVLLFIGVLFVDKDGSTVQYVSTVRIFCEGTGTVRRYAV